MPKPTSNQILNKSGVAGSTLTDALETLRTSGSFGDMSKSTYDVNDNGKVDVAEVAEKVEWVNVDNKPFAFPPSPHTHSDVTVSDSGFMSTSDKTKLDGISAGATVNDTDANLKNRANHTGTQAISTVTGLQNALDAKQETFVSGTNIKTVNGNSLLGSGNLVISGGGGGGGGVTDHGDLTGLADDDHTQYHNDARGDLRYSQLGHTHVTSDVTGLVSALAGKEPAITAGTTGQYLQGDKSWQDLGSAVRAVLMTGVSFVTNSAVVAGDTLIQAIGKIQAQINGYAAAVLTFTNKRINPRVTSETSSATPTINTNNTDIHRITALAANITSFTTNLSGTPVHGQGLLVEITGTAARTLSWGASFEAGTIALPTTTVSTSMLTVAFVWNSGTSKWRCVGVV